MQRRVDNSYLPLDRNIVREWVQTKMLYTKYIFKIINIYFYGKYKILTATTHDILCKAKMQVPTRKKLHCCKKRRRIFLLQENSSSRGKRIIYLLHIEFFLPQEIKFLCACKKIYKFI